MADRTELMRALKESMQEIFKEEIKKIPYQYSKIGTVTAIEGNLVKVKIGENTQTCSFISGLNLLINDVVIVMFTNGDNLTKIIYGKL